MSSNQPPRNYFEALKTNLKSCAKGTKLRVYSRIPNTPKIPEIEEKIKKKKKKQSMEEEETLLHLAPFHDEQ